MDPHARYRSLPPKGAQFALGAARRANGTPTLAKVLRSLPPKGAQFALGAARRANG
jgi:hypothetical protein